MTMTAEQLAQLRKEISNPSIGSKDHLRNLSLMLLDELERKDKHLKELDARTVTLPPERFRYGESDYDDGYANGWNAHGIETKSALRAVGVTVEG